MDEFTYNELVGELLDRSIASNGITFVPEARLLMLKAWIEAELREREAMITG